LPSAAVDAGVIPDQVEMGATIPTPKTRSFIAAGVKNELREEVILGQVGKRDCRFPLGFLYCIVGQG